MSNQILSIDAVMAAMQHYAEAKEAEVAARAGYDVWPWDYHGSRYLHTSEDAKKEAREVLEKYIQACVVKALQERGLCG